MNSAALDRLHQWLGRSRVVTRFALAVRNQCRAVIKYRLMSGHDLDRSGERWLADRIGAGVRTFVDVGANRGDWTAMLLGRAPGATAGVLFEPAPAAAALLRSRFASDARLEIVEAAVADRRGDDVAFFEEPDLGEQSSLTAAATRDATMRRVRLATLDDELGRLGIERVDLLKIDTEGSDFAALRGAACLLREGRVAVVQWEYGDAWALAGATLGSALRFLAECEYDSFLLKADGVHRFDYAMFGDFFSYANFVSLPRGSSALAAEARSLL
jgi:FkbM family methyltransferase